MESESKIKYLVVDTTGFIKNAQFQEMAINIITVPPVTKEITSRSQLRRLAVLPYDLNVKEPFLDSIQHVTEFAKKTGDYGSLSAADLQVIAMTYQLEKEHVGDQNLRAEPLKSVINPVDSLEKEFKEFAGFVSPKVKPRPPKQTDKQEENVPITEVNVNIKEDLAELKDESDEGFDIEDGDENDCEDSEEEGEEELDDEGWITPSNLKEVKLKILSEVENEKKPVVACLTTDFAMQNVLKQMGLEVVSLDGRAIKQLRTFILRCYACFKTTSIMSKIFCPNCGNKTLKKVAVTTNPDGTQQIHINFRKPLTARGKRFSLPTPKGGKHANNPILCEDQPMPQQRSSRLSRAKTNALDEDYMTGFSPFVARDVTSRSALLGIRPDAQIKQWMRRNPNESTKPGGRKRK